MILVGPKRRYELSAVSEVETGGATGLRHDASLYDYEEHMNRFICHMIMTVKLNNMAYPQHLFIHKMDPMLEDSTISQTNR